MDYEIPLPLASNFWIPRAKGEIGTKEIRGQEHNPRVLEYHAQTTLKATTDEVPWCSAFVTWVMEKSQIPSTRSAWARSWLNWGQELEEPVMGCIVVLSRGGSPTKGHVGFYMGEKDGYLHILGGNQGNEVKISKYGKERLLSYRWPLEEWIDDLGDIDG